MGITAFSGPTVTYGQAPASQMPTAGYNEDLGPSLFFGGAGLLDPRWPVGVDIAATATAQPRYGGFPDATGTPTLDVVPPTLSNVAIAGLQVPVANVALTKVTSTALGITVLAAAIQPQPGGSLLPAGTLCIDQVPTLLTVSQTGSIGYYDPAKIMARNVTITSVGVDTGATFLVSGNDVYGFPMSERITGATSGATAAGKKAFKFVRSIVPAGTLSGSNVSVGVGDVFGFPLYSQGFPYLQVWWNSALISATTGYLAGVTTSPATVTTGDVRGTYAVQSASDGTKRLQVFQTVRPVDLLSVTGLFGVTQV